MVPDKMEQTTTVVVFDPYIIGHHVHKLRFTLKELRRIPNLTVLPVANKSKVPDCIGYYWEQTKIQSPPILLFFRYLLLVLNILRSSKGKRVLLNNAFDNTWKHFGLLGILLVPLFRASKINLRCLQFRTNYLKHIASLTDLLQLLAFKILQVGLGRSFTLLVTIESHTNANEGIEYLPDLLDIPDELPSRREARSHLGLPPEARIILFFGDIEEPRRGFELMVRNFDAIPGDWKLLVMRPSGLKYEQFMVRYSSRIYTVIPEVSHSDKVMMFRAADAVVLLYPENFAGSSGVMTDAIMYEVPVITTRFSYAKEILSKYEVGVFVDGSSPESFGRAFVGFDGSNYSQDISRCKKDMIKDFRSQIRKAVLDNTREDSG